MRETPKTREKKHCERILFPTCLQRNIEYERERMSVPSATRSAPPRHPPPPIMSASTKAMPPGETQMRSNGVKEHVPNKTEKYLSRGLERGQGGCRACQARTLVSPGICSSCHEKKTRTQKFLRLKSYGLCNYFSHYWGDDESQLISGPGRVSPRGASMLSTVSPRCSFDPSPLPNNEEAFLSV